MTCGPHVQHLSGFCGMSGLSSCWLSLSLDRLSSLYGRADKGIEMKRSLMGMTRCDVCPACFVTMVAKELTGPDPVTAALAR